MGDIKENTRWNSPFPESESNGAINLGQKKSWAIGTFPGCNKVLNYLQLWSFTTVAAPFSQLQSITSKCNYKVLHTSKCNYKVLHTSKCNYKLLHTSKCNYKVLHRNVITKCCIKMQLQSITSKCNYKVLHQNAITVMHQNAITVLNQNAITKYYIEIQLQSITSKCFRGVNSKICCNYFLVIYNGRRDRCRSMHVCVHVCVHGVGHFSSSFLRQS
jgi:hypothetical protein